MKEKKNEKLYLFWLCNQTGRRHPAGVAFYNDPQGDYRLKIDALPDDKLIYLKTSSLHEGKVLYRVETVVKKNGLPAHRAEVGTGYAKADEGYPIYMDIGPFSRTLMMEQASK